MKSIMIAMYIWPITLFVLLGLWKIIDLLIMIVKLVRN